MDPELVDRIYESSFLPELWPSVLDDLAGLASARGGLLFAARADTGIFRWAASASIHADTSDYVAGGWIAQGERFPRASRSKHPGFMTEHDIYTDEELALDPVYRDFLRPRGLGWAAGTSIEMPTGDILILSLERDYARGPVEADAIRRLDILRPHLARSAMLSTRLQLERARTVSETLALIGLPAAVLDEAGKVMAANRLVEDAVDQVRWRARDRITLKDPEADALFRAAVADFGQASDGIVRSFVVRGEDARASSVAHVVPIRGGARDLFARCAAVLVLTPVVNAQGPPVELIQSLFDLTASEARVARGLAAGETVDEIAATGQVSRNTVRTQIRGVLEKTGCRRQVEVATLLGGLAPPNLG